MAVQRLARALYARASDSRAFKRPLDAVRANARVRAFARRHVGVLLARGTTWANVDGALRLLTEDPSQRVVFGPWEGDTATELLYWAPFVRWAQAHFSLDPARAAAVSRTGAGHWYGDACGLYTETIDDARRALPDAAVFPPEPVLALVEAYRSGAAPPRPLLKRTLHVPLAPPAGGAGKDSSRAYVAVDLRPTPAFPGSEQNRKQAAMLIEVVETTRPVVSLEEADTWHAKHALVAGAGGLIAAYSGIALLGAFSGVPVIALRSADGTVVEPDVDLALRVASQLGGSLTVLDVSDLTSLRSGLGGVSVLRDGKVQ